MGVMVLAGGVLAGVLLTRSDRVARQLSDDVQPSRVAAYQLQGALRDQETAVRGYLLSADPQFLEPYSEGRRTEEVAAAEIRQHLVGRPDLLADLSTIEEAADSWRANFAEPLIASVTPGTPNLVNQDLAERGRAEFDRIRGLFDQQNIALNQARLTSLEQLDNIRDWRDRVLIGVIAVVLLTAVLLAVLVRRTVTRPLEALAAACRRVTDGNFGETIPVRGPKDIRAIAGDVEDMRQRMVAELDASTAARVLLVEQAEALDEQAEELRRSNAELEQFAYVASHDLQEPLRKVTSFCQLLERRYGDKLDERGVEYIAFAVDGAKRMQVLINDLLTFSRVGRLNATDTEVDLDVALDAALDNLATAVGESGAEIRRPAEGLPVVSGDPTLLTMLWQNLIGNAVKFQRPGVVPRIAVDVRPGDGEHDGQWVFEVSDNGIGIDDDFVDKVFVIFQRLHGRDAYGGTGIGLALCKKIVEHHGGAIWIDTSYSDGTRFTFTLPRHAETQTPIALEGTRA
ncbi:sensor histidine kinase [Mycolicibacterium palauense]|uniref:sensor histidine kinase n=1 Tax=Mycolicibacterium palauense TaxID=2034511 RepID=UPI000BFF08BB|nr:sensor histidine kinase [Mycolicibacterium palauense]